jgi:hypothetical protein
VLAAQLTVGHFVLLAGARLRLGTAPAGIARRPGRAIVLIEHCLSAMA